MTFLYPKQTLAGGSGMAIFHAGASGRRVRQAADADVEISTHQTAGLDKVSVPDELGTGNVCDKYPS